MPPMGHTPTLEKQPLLSLKSEGHFQEMIPRKTTQKFKTVINTCVSPIKQCWQKMTEIPQKQDRKSWSIQNFVRKMKRFIRKYYVTGLIDVANKLYDRKIIVSFLISSVSCFIKKFCKQICSIKFNLIACT